MLSGNETALADWLLHFWSDSLSATARAWIRTSALAFAGVACLQAIYIFLRTSWPETYTSLDTRIERQYHREPFRSVVLFRCLPVAIVTMLIAEYLERTQGFVWEGITGLVIVYLGLSTGRAIVDVLRKPRHPNYLYFLLYHLTQALLVVGSSYCGVVFHDLWGKWAPTGSDMTLALLTGAFAATAAIGFRSLLSPAQMTNDELIRELREDIGESIIEYAHRQCFRLDPSGDLSRLIEAILLAEAQQRPKLVRRLERVIGKFRKSGTYGVAQVKSSKPISDKESIDVLIRTMLVAEQEVGCGGPITEIELAQMLFDFHNSDEEHVKRIIELSRALYNPY